MATRPTRSAIPRDSSRAGDSSAHGTASVAPNEFGGGDAATRGVQAAAQPDPRGRQSQPAGGCRGVPRPGIRLARAARYVGARPGKGDIGQQACGAGMASRPADGNHSGVARPSRHWATGDCARFEKPVRLGLRQSSGAPRLPAFTASSHRHHRCFCLLLVAAIRRCNELRLLSRRIIIRLFDDVKKKVQKTCVRERVDLLRSRIAMTHHRHACSSRLTRLPKFLREVNARRFDGAAHCVAQPRVTPPPPSLAHLRRLPVTRRQHARRGAPRIRRKAAWMLAFTAMAS